MQLHAQSGKHNAYQGLFFAAVCCFVLPDCAKVACRSIDLQLVSVTGKAFSLTLLDGSTFTTYALNTVTIKALPGQHVVKPGQSVPIMLERDASAK